MVVVQSVQGIDISVTICINPHSPDNALSFGATYAIQI